VILDAGITSKGMYCVGDYKTSKTTQTQHRHVDTNMLAMSDINMCQTLGHIFNLRCRCQTSTYVSFFVTKHGHNGYDITRKKAHLHLRLSSSPDSHNSTKLRTQI
jgi:hypothetical protein